MSKKANLKIEINYAYTKLRSQFGKKPNFSDRLTEININIPNDEQISKTFCRLEYADIGIEAIPNISLVEVNTNYIEKVCSGVNHVEGGWPKDIHPFDAEQTTRFRKKVEKEETYMPSMLHLCKTMEEKIMENNAINIYEEFFESSEVIDEPPNHGAHVYYSLRDLSGEFRPVSSTCWHPFDGTQRIAVAHCNLDFQMAPLSSSTESYIWCTENPFVPELVLKPQFQLTTLSYCYKEASLLAAGQYNGQVSFFDIRRGSKPVETSFLPISHIDPITDLVWIQSKGGFECFTTSTDGQVLWWDMRNMNEAADQMSIDPGKKNDIKASEGGCSLEYEPTIPTKFMVGTEAGKAFVCTRRARTPQEKIGLFFDVQIGPVRRIQRNPFYSKVFLTAGDWRLNVWSEDVLSSPIWSIPFHNSYVMNATWSTQRPFLFYVVKADGSFDVWDLMYAQKNFQYSIKVCDDRLFNVNCQEEGRHVALGSAKGLTYVMLMNSGSYEIQKNEKNNFITMMDREAKREKILEGKEREKKLAKKKAVADAEVEKEHPKQTMEMSDVLEQTCANFFQIISQEQRKMDRESSNITNTPLRFPNLDKPVKVDVVQQLQIVDPAQQQLQLQQQLQQSENLSTNAIYESNFVEPTTTVLYQREPEPAPDAPVPINFESYSKEFRNFKDNMKVFDQPLDIFSNNNTFENDISEIDKFYDAPLNVQSTKTEESKSDIRTVSDLIDEFYEVESSTASMIEEIEVPSIPENSKTELTKDDKSEELSLRNIDIDDSP